MSFFDKVETYLNKNGIELTEQDYTPSGRFELLDDGEKTYIRRWDFIDVKQPTNEELEQLQEDEDEKEKTKQRKQQQKLQRKLKTLKIPAINSNDLKIKDLNDFDECLFFNISTKKLNYILNGKVNILF
jgi:hypothetical protein